MKPWMVGLVAAAFVGVAIPAAAKNGAIPARPATDLEAAFTRGFPAVADEHHVTDWLLYTALVDGDVVAYAARVDDTVRARLEAARGKGYQTQQLEAAITQDRRMRAAFDEQRHRLQTMVLYADDPGEVSGGCSRSIVYIGTEFRLMLGSRARGADALTHATVAPGCAPANGSGVQITAGRSPRFKCWPAVQDATCGWRLPDMPDSLKEVIESRYPESIKLRWRWRGLGDVNRIRTIDAYADGGNPLAVTTPHELELEFVDGDGRVLWTAASAWSHR